MRSARRERARSRKAGADPGRSGIAAHCRAPWLPDPCNAPQVQAYTSPADLLLYGGAAGGGKTDLLIGLALTDARALGDLPPRLCGPRRDRAAADRNPRQPRGLQRDRHDAAPAGCLIEFGALERPGSEFTWQGRSHDFIGFDEGAQLDERKVRFVMGWLRSTDGPALPRGDRLQPADRRRRANGC